MTILQSAIAQSAAGGGAYQITRSLRSNSADTPYLTRTPASAGNRKTWTWSGWVKKSRNGEFFTMLQANYSSTPWNVMGFDDTDKFSFDLTAGVSAGWATTAVFRDLSAWYHFVFVLDTTSATSTMNGSATDRIRAYVNGVQLVLSGGTVPTQNADFSINNNIAHYIGGYLVGRYNNGYMTEINFIDGQALTPSSFGQTDSATGVWNPIAYTGSYGTNGFYLNFSDNSNTTAATLGKDYSGNSNNWTPNNFSVTAGVGNDSLVDSPTNYGTDTGVGGSVRGNYCTLNPLDKGSDVNTVVNGNLDATWINANGMSIRSTMSVSSGKWYWEFTNVNNLSSGVIQQQLKVVPQTGSLWPGADGFGVGGSYGYFPDTGNKYTNSTGTAYGATYTTTDVMSCALDMDNGKIWWAKNGVWQASGDPAAGTNAAFTGLSGNFSPAWGYQGAGSNTLTANFGQRAFAYTAPTGFKALCSQNFATPAIGASSTTLAGNNMNVALYTGNGTSSATTQAITGVGFQPDLVWIKNRATGVNHVLTDAVRGTTAILSSNATDSEAAFDATWRSNYGQLTAFGSDGFTVAAGSVAGGNFNYSGQTYVGWAFKGGNGTVSNTSGSITSTVSANPTAGFSIVTYTSTTGTVGHGLGVAPTFIIMKGRNATDQWTVGHPFFNSGVTPWNYGTTLNDTVGTQSNSAFWNNTAPTSSVFSQGSWNNGNTKVAYCFAEVAGFSKINTYVGNGSTDGPFIYCGFRPRYIMVKRIDAAGDWKIWDAARVTYNVDNLVLWANLANAEGNQGTQGVDLLSNGVKIRSNDTIENAANGTYFFIAFAESPFNYSRAR